MSGQGKTREAQTSPSEPEGMRRIEDKVDALANGFVTTADTIATMATSMTTALDALSLLRATLEDVQRELAELRANARNGVTMQAQGRQITVPGGGTLPFSLGVKSDGLIYVAGTLATEGDIKTQTKAVLDNFAQAGFDVFAGSESFLLQNMRHGGAGAWWAARSTT